MGKKSIPKRYCCNEYMSGKFSMVTPELLEHDGFQNLSYGAQMFYIVLLTHKETDQQRSCLFATLKEYNEILNLGMTDVDIRTEATPNARSGNYSHGYFVAPSKQLEQYGYTRANITRLKNELIEKGFIRAAFGGKGKYNGWNKNVTIYQFIDTWKSFCSSL